MYVYIYECINIYIYLSLTYMGMSIFKNICSIIKFVYNDRRKQQLNKYTCRVSRTDFKRYLRLNTIFKCVKTSYYHLHKLNHLMIRHNLTTNEDIMSIHIFESILNTTI